MRYAALTSTRTASSLSPLSSLPLRKKSQIDALRCPFLRKEDCCQYDGSTIMSGWMKHPSSMDVTVSISFCLSDPIFTAFLAERSSARICSNCTNPSATPLPPFDTSDAGTGEKGMCSSKSPRPWEIAATTVRVQFRLKASLLTTTKVCACAAHAPWMGRGQPSTHRRNGTYHRPSFPAGAPKSSSQAR